MTRNKNTQDKIGSDITSQSLCCKQQTQRSNKQYTLLVAEQNSAIQELLLFIFTLHGYHSVVVDMEQITSLSWIEHCIQTRPDGIVLDIDMQARTFQSSCEFMHAFCTRWYTTTDHSLTPLVLLTTQKATLNTLQQAGYTVVMKPFQLQDLLGQVQARIEQQQERGRIAMGVGETRVERREREELLLAGPRFQYDDQNNGESFLIQFTFQEKYTARLLHS